MIPEEIEKQLYSKFQETKKDGALRKGKILPKISKKRFMKPVLFFAVLPVLLLAAFGFFLINQFNNSSRDIAIEINGVKEVNRGAVFEINVNISNKTEGILRDAVLNLNLPTGLVSLGQGSKNLVSEPIGDIGGGGLAKKTYKFLATGENKSIQNMSARLTYVLGSGTKFEVNQNKEILIKDSAIGLSIKKPDQILSGSEFELEVSYKNITDFDYPEIVLEAEYPQTFKFISSELQPESLNNRWRLGELKAGSKGSFQIRGAFEGVDGASFNIPFAVYANFLGQDYLIVRETPDFKIAPSPIGIGALLNGREDYTARIGDRLTYTIQYKNNSGIALADVVVRASLKGELFDLGTVQSNVNFDRANQTLIWNASNVSQLRLLEPGGGGEVNFDVKLKPEFPINRLNDKNFSLRLDVAIDSPSVPYYISAAKTHAVSFLETKVSGLILIDTKAFYRDALSGIVNTGLMPPKVNQPTEYTIHWIIKNYSTDTRNVEIKALLKPDVEWTGILKSNTDSVPLYDERTREVTWRIDKIQATKGILSTPLEAIFQIRATPMSTEIGEYQPILSETNLTATDEFTGLELVGSDLALSTLLPDDNTIGQEGGRVVP